MPPTANTLPPDLGDSTSMTLRTVFLDFGHTLVRESPSRHAIYAEAATRAGREVSEQAMAGYMQRAHDELPRVAAGAYRYTDEWFVLFIERIFHGYLGFPVSALPALEGELFARFSDAATFVLFPGAHELCQELRAAGLTTGVISNWSPRLEPLLTGLGLAEHLDVVVCSATEQLEKPDPRIFQLALERAGGTPGEALHAGDHAKKDVAAARAVGMSAVLVDHGGTHVPSPGGPVRVASLGELLEHVLEQVA